MFFERVASPRARRLLTAALLTLGGHLASALVLSGSPAAGPASNLFQIAAGLIAAAVAVDASGRGAGLSRRFWALVAMAFFIWTAAQATFAYQEWLGLEVVQPSWTHFLFRLYGAPLIMALLIVDEERRGAENIAASGTDWQQTLDFIEVGIIFPLFYAYLFLVPGEFSGLAGLSLWGFFGFSDVENWFLVSAFAARATLSRSRSRRALSARFLPYLAVYALGSSYYNFANTRQALQTGSWHDCLFTLALTVASVLAARWREPVRVQEAEPSGIVNWATVSLPLITLVLALPMARSDARLSIIAVFISVACLGARLLVTLHRRQELMEALLASEARYASLVRLAPDAIFVHAGGRITFANPATARILGYEDAASIVGRQALDFVAPERKDEVARIRGGLGSESAARQLVCVRPDGSRVILDAVGMTLSGNPEQPASVSRLVIARDVTEHARAEAEREALIRGLEAKNAELERFTYTVSHDLRSPLITITGFLGHIEAAAARADLEAVRSDLNRVRRAAVRMDRLLRDLLDLARTGHVLSPVETIPFHEVAREAVDRVHGRLSERGVRVEIARDLPEVRGDRMRLVEVVLNLVENAVKFMGVQKAPRVEIGLRRGNGEEAFFVRDNGMGVEERFQEQVFGLFNKLDPKDEGTGAGLALVRRIVELHGGKIWLESAGPGQGSTFLFTLGSPS